MKTYEMLYVLDAGLSDEAKESFITKFEGIVTDNGGTVDSTERVGVKKLSYPINYKTDGYYVVTTYQAEGSVNKELMRVANLSTEVLRKMITVK